MKNRLVIPSLPTFTDGIDIPLRKVNYFYGKNGTGKSSITRYIRDHKEALADRGQSVLIYDTKFKEDMETGIQGIYTFGSDNSSLLEMKEELTNEIDEIDAKIEQYEKNIEKTSAEMESCLDSLADLVWKERSSLAKSYGTDWSRKYNNNRIKLAKDLLEKFEEYSADTTSAERINEMNNLLTRDSISRLDLQSKIDEMGIDTSIFATQIVSHTENELNEYYRRLNNIDWVKEGRGYSDGQLCPYCRQNLPSDFKEQLEEIFSQVYEEKMEALSETIADLDSYYALIESRLSGLELDMLDGFDYISLASLRQSITDTIKVNRLSFDKKRDSPSLVVELEPLEEKIKAYNQAIELLNAQITKHNEDVDGIKEVVKEFSTAIWGLLAKGSRGDVLKYRDREKELSQSLSDNQKELETLIGKRGSKASILRGINAQITDITKTVDDINGLLASYGFTNFKLVQNEPSDGTYRIVRPDGSDVGDTLSEGESNLVAYLYFFFSVRGSVDPDNMNAHKIVVIDDPVNSMDGDVMSIIIQVTREIIRSILYGNDIKNVDQVLIFTHNIHFHSESEYGTRDGIEYNRIIKHENRSVIHTSEESTLVNAYQQLWVEFATSDSPTTSFNNMRRILQHFFENIVGMETFKDCQDKFHGTDKIRVGDLTREVNRGSHSIWDHFEFNQDEETIEIYKRIFKEIFERTGYISHYNLMMEKAGVGGTTDESEEDNMATTNRS